MDHFYRNIDGWPGELPTLYADAVRNAPVRGSHFVEVGCWKGSSAAAMCVEIINSGKSIKFDCVDKWPDYNNNYQQFVSNLEPVRDYYRAIRLPSVEAAPRYEDNSLDFVCIDAGHSYSDVRDDINAWLPKVKSGCLLAGDDYMWPGVNRAVNELLPGFEHWRNTWFWRKP